MRVRGQNEFWWRGVEIFFMGGNKKWRRGGQKIKFNQSEAEKLSHTEDRRHKMDRQTDKKSTNWQALLYKQEPAKI